MGIFTSVSLLFFVIINLCQNLLSEDKQVIAARGFSKVSSIDEYAGVARDLGADYKVIRIEADESELMIRVQSPERKADFNPTIDKAHAIAWMSENPLEEYEGELKVNNQRPVAETVADIISKV